MRFVLISFFLIVVTGCGSQVPETLITSGYDEKEMDAAIARARREVDDFIKVLEKGDSEEFAVKAKSHKATVRNTSGLAGSNSKAIPSTARSKTNLAS